MRKEESDENWLETRFVQPNGAARVAQDASNRRSLPFKHRKLTTQQEPGASHTKSWKGCAVRRSQYTEPLRQP
jgi:hypothetical protein